jgi:hypothetical protein
MNNEADLSTSLNPALAQGRGCSRNSSTRLLAIFAVMTTIGPAVGYKDNRAVDDKAGAKR